MTTTGITQLYYKFLGHLRTRTEFIAPLQLTGRLEDYLVHEFIGYAYGESGGKLLGLSNLGNRGEQKIDIAFVQGTSPETPVIIGLVEAKYLRNAHRFSPIDSAKDEVLTTLKDFHRQVRRFERNQHARIQVHLRSRNGEVYGLIFVSYTKPVNQSRYTDKEEFFAFVKQRAGGLGFRFLDYEAPHLNKIYEDKPVDALGTKYHVSLRTGLWRAGRYHV
jgi:hypothetical protein